jgi:hypothetical protein
LLIAKAKTIGLELVRSAQPRPHARTVGKKSENAYRIATEAESRWAARNRGAKNSLAVETIEGEETSYADREGCKKYVDSNPDLPFRMRHTGEEWRFRFGLIQAANNPSRNDDRGQAHAPGRISPLRGSVVLVLSRLGASCAVARYRIILPRTELLSNCFQA